jgi:putative endonuclease
MEIEFLFMDNQNIGKWGEIKAKKYLDEKGIRILGINLRTHYGELDIIGQDNGQVVFFEVKTRRTNSFGFGEESVSWAKQEHLVNSAEEYMQNHSDLGEDWRIDVVVIDGGPTDSEVTIRWFKNAVPGS